MTILTNPPLPQQPHEILIHGRLYDVTHFKHPGGSIMKFYSGSGDATEAYDQFHVQLPRANKYLDALPSRPAPTDLSVDVKEQKRLAKLSADFQALFKECQDLGYFKPHIPHIIYRFTELILIHALGLWMLFNAPAFLVPVALLILGVGEGRCGWWMHEAGHYSCTGIPAVDIKIQEIVYGFGDGMSAAWWRVQHNKHHAATQQLGKDADLETLPLVAFNKETAKSGKAHPLVRWWISKQKYMFIPVTCSLVALYWQLFLHPRHILRTHRYTEAVAILSRWLTIAFICHQLEVSFVTGLCCTLLSQMFGAIYIFFTFAMNHSFLPVVGRHERRHHVEHASFAVNLNHHWLVTWWMAFLNFHVEHHLFPSMPQCRFVKLQPKIRSLLECNGIHYDSRPYIETFCTTLKNLGEVATSMYEDA